MWNFGGVGELSSSGKVIEASSVPKFTGEDFFGGYSGFFSHEIFTVEELFLGPIFMKFLLLNF